MDVDALVPIGKLIDRDFPDYSYVPLLRAPFSENYLKYVKTRACERVRVGRADQIKLLRAPERYPSFDPRSPSEICGRLRRPPKLRRTESGGQWRSVDRRQ
jgi:hypothetical protein